MKLYGKVETVEKIEKVVRGSGKVFLHNGGNHTVAERRKIQGRGFQSRMFHRHYMVRVDSLLVDVKLTFDYRDRRGEFACVDDKIWLVAVGIPGLADLLRLMTPFATHYYANMGMNREALPIHEKTSVL